MTRVIASPIAGALGAMILVAAAGAAPTDPIND